MKVFNSFLTVLAGTVLKEFPENRLKIFTQKLPKRKLAA
jgi:hypothetical protein